MKHKIRPEIQKYLDKLKEETQKDLAEADRIDKESQQAWYNKAWLYK
mgnify:CR=1 FL=1